MAELPGDAQFSAPDPSNISAVMAAAWRSQAGGIPAADDAGNSDDTNSGTPASPVPRRDRVTSSPEHPTGTTRWVGLGSASPEGSAQSARVRRSATDGAVL